MSAYDTIKDPGKRRAYDTQWVHIRSSQRAQQEAQKRQAEAAEAEQRRVAKEKANEQKRETARQERVRPLVLLRSRGEGDIFEVNRVVRRLAADLKRIQDQDDEEAKKEREKNSWWTYVTSPIYGKPIETEQDRQERETGRLQRLANKSIKEKHLSQSQAKLQNLSEALQDVINKIDAVKEEEEEDEARIQAVKRQEQLLKEHEARRRAKEEQTRERQARWEELQTKLRNEQAASAAKAAREAQEAREERARKAEIENRKAEERERVARVAEAARKVQEARNNRFRPATFSQIQPPASAFNQSMCRHGKFWPRVEGNHLCGTCHSVQRRFAFRCPGCSIVACANCRQTLRGERVRNN